MQSMTAPKIQLTSIKRVIKVFKSMIMFYMYYYQNNYKKENYWSVSHEIIKNTYKKGK